MIKPFGIILGVLGMFPGAWIGYRLGGWKGAMIGFLTGAFVSFFVQVLAFPSVLNNEEMKRRHGMDVKQLVRSFSVLFFIAAGVFVVLTPASLRGAYLGYANPFIPLTLGMGAIFAVVRLKQRYPFSEVRTSEKLFGWPLGFLWMLAIFSVFLWHSDPIALSVSKIQRGEYQDAITMLDDVIRKSPGNTMAHQNRGYARLCIGDLAGAIDDYTQVVQKEPRNTVGYLMRGIAKKLKGENPEEDFDAFLKLEPEGKSKIDRTIAEVQQIQEKSSKPMKE